MSLVYSVYGLRVLADGPIPGLLASGGADDVDIRIWLNQMPPWWENRSDENDAVWYRSANGNGLTVWKLGMPGWYRLVYFDGAEFVVHPRDGEIWSRWAPAATLGDSAPYLVGPILGFVLRLREICCLHSSAVVIGQQVVAFAGAPYAGKSTTAAAFASMGYPVVSDDIVALMERDRKIFVRPGYPRLCLWPDAASSLYGASSRLPRISPEGGISDWWDKRYVDLISAGHDFQDQILPLSAIYILHQRMGDDDCPKVETISTPSALIGLSANTYMNYLLDRGLRSKEFQFLGRLASIVPVRRLVPHTDPSRLARLCEVILQDQRGLA